MIINNAKGLNFAGDGSLSFGNVPPGDGHHGDRWCYAASSGYHQGDLRVGHRYPVEIALSNAKDSPTTTRTRKLKTRTTRDATTALGCRAVSSSTYGSGRVRAHHNADAAADGMRVDRRPHEGYRGSLDRGALFHVIRFSPSEKYARGYAQQHHHQPRGWVHTSDLG